MTPEEFNSSVLTISKPLRGSIPYDRTYQINIKKKYEGMTLLEVYENVMPHITNKIWKEQIEQGEILLDTKKVHFNHIVKAGQITTRVITDTTEPTVSSNIELIHAEENFWILNKPAPLPVHPAGRFNKNTLIFLLELAFPEQQFYLVHRLDANTTGVFIIALNQKTSTYFINQFKEKSIDKEYIALVEGIPEKDEFVLSDTISKEKSTSGSRTLDNGFTAETRVKIIERLSKLNQSLLRVKPSTGRTNQIRLHLAKNGFPILGDHGYKDESYFESHPMTYESDCLYLHAHQLNFKHPITKEDVSFSAPLPQKFK